MPDASGRPVQISDLAAIEAVVQTYFDGLYEGDVEKLGAAFHPCAHLYSADGKGGVSDLPREEWFAAVKTRPSGKVRGLARADRILLVDQSGPETAMVKVNCQLPPRYFTDYLVLNLTSEGWRIVSKVFRADTRE